jgi:hypothetical protein
MSRAPIIMTALMLSVAPTFALANEQGAVAGAVTGGVAGAIIGGPIGAAIGVVVGGAAGGVASGPSQDPSVQEPAAFTDRRPVAPGALPYEPEATGSVSETTCVRDSRGIARCRRQTLQ